MNGSTSGLDDLSRQFPYSDFSAWPDAARWVAHEYDPRDPEDAARCEAAFGDCLREVREARPWCGDDFTAPHYTLLAEVLALSNERHIYDDDLDVFYHGNPRHMWDLLGRLVALGLVHLTLTVRHLYADGLQQSEEAQREWFVRSLDARQAAMRANGGSHTKKEWKILLRTFDYRCVRCGAADEYQPLTEDHVVPVAKGGSDDISNIQPMCRPCNSSKHTDTLDYRPAALARLGKSAVQP